MKDSEIKKYDGSSNFLNYCNASHTSIDRSAKKTIIVDGCSMIGTMFPIGSSSNSKRERADIGAQFSEKWDFNRISLNMPGKSNCSIFRDTTNFLLYNYKKFNLSYENLFLIIEWSGLARYSYFNREKMGWEIYHLIVSDTESGKMELHPGKNLDYHSIIEEHMNRFLYQISVANLCENLGVNYIMYNGCDDIASYQAIDEHPTELAARIKEYFKYKESDTTIYDDFDNLYEVLLTKNFLDIPCTGYFGYETGRYKKDKDRLKKYTYDGLHMNKLGHQEWRKILEDFIIEKGMGDFINDR